MRYRLETLGLAVETSQGQEGDVLVLKKVLTFLRP